MSQNNTAFSGFFSALILAVGLLASAFLINQGLINFRSYERFVTVKGLATQEVEADLVIWQIRHAATGNDLPTVQADVEANTQKIQAFLKNQGLSDADITSRKTEVTDFLALSYRQGGTDENNRYIVAETIVVRTNKVAQIDEAAQNLGDLIRQGVSLSQENGSGRPEYIYTKLNDIKPVMIAAATKSARESAQQFANDSGTNVGQIKEAYQGVFEILPRDSDQSYQERQERYKTVRVVSTIKFYLQ